MERHVREKLSRQLALQDRGFVGMQACVMDRAIVETEAMVAAGALVPPGKVVNAHGKLAGQ